MTDWTKPTTLSLYTNYTQELINRDLSLAVDFDSAIVTTDTGQPVGTRRWNSSTNLWERWSGAAWVVAAATYGISISGTAANASALGGVAPSGYALVAGNAAQVFSVSNAAAAANAVPLGQADGRYAAIAQVHYIGTTAIAANQATGTITTLNGVNISGNAATATNATNTTNLSGGTVAATSIASSGGIISSSPTAGVGYATGAGGSVVQLTSKSTTVTLHKLCGKITTANTAMTAYGSGVGFLFVNNTIAIGDTISFSYTSPGGFIYLISACALGTANQGIWIIAAFGAPAEAIDIYFTVNKSVTA